MSPSSERRLKRLRDLIGELERLPPSPERERMLREVRARVVDVDTGETPSAMLPTGPAESPAELGRPRTVPVPKPAKPVHVASRKRLPVTAGPAAPVTGDGDRLLPAAGEVLSLDDSPSLAPTRDPHARPSAAPWTRGLRG